MNDLIKQVGGISRAKEIVSNMPDGATNFVRSTYLKLIGAVWWEVWQPEWNHDDNCMVYIWKGESIEMMSTWGEVISLNNLRQAIADYNTDHCTNIENHISPSTKVINK